jgi:tetratricopeptide (TPR) repeat protein/DNA-binding XRE family transcriptional regulator
MVGILTGRLENAGSYLQDGNDVDVDDGGFGARLRGCRRAAGLSQRELADRSGLSVRAIRNMEGGHTQWPYRDSLSRLADALGLHDTARAAFLAAIPRRQLAQQSRHVPGAASVGDGPGVPRQLPAGARHFTGREAELVVLDDLLAEAAADGQGTAAITAISGTAGVGKTALALRWAHQVAHRFPDGQLYVNLRGYDQDDPVPAETALASFLRALGVPGPDVPAGAEDRAAAYRSLLAGRKMLIVLDNAARVEQVRPLLPGGASCFTLVTSRDSLPGLVARDGAVPVELDPLPRADAVSLLGALIGERVSADQDAAERLAERCCRLPLALRVAAVRATARTGVPLAVLADELGRQSRLDLLEAGGDSATAVREVLSWSLRHLDPATARAFDLAALHPGPDLDAWALMALAGGALAGRGPDEPGHDEAEQRLSELALAHLLQPAGPCRYGLHDLLRAYGCERAAAGASGIDERGALTGLLDYLRDTAAAAIAIVYPAGGEHRPRLPGHAQPLSPVTGEQSARHWLEAERATLIAAIAFAARSGWPGHATILAGLLAEHLEVGGHYAEAVTVHQSGLHAARLGGDPQAEATALRNLGEIRLRQGEHAEALLCFEQAWKLTRRTGNTPAEYHVLHGLARLNRMQGRYHEAARYYQEILDLSRSTGSQRQQIRGLYGLGDIALRTGKYEQAACQLREAASLCDVTGDQVFLAYVLNNLGYLRLLQGRYRQADDYLGRCLAVCLETGDQVIGTYASCWLALSRVRAGHYSEPEVESGLREALARFRAAGNRHGEAQALICLGEFELRAGRPQEARDDLDQAQLIAAQTGELDERAEALNLLGQVFLATADPDSARSRHDEALMLATQLGDPYQRALAHRGLAAAEAALGNQAEARRHSERELACLADLGIPEPGDPSQRVVDVR